MCDCCRTPKTTPLTTATMSDLSTLAVYAPIKEIHYAQADGAAPFELHVVPDEGSTGFLLTGNGPHGAFECYCPPKDEEVTLDLSRIIGVPYIVLVEPRFGDDWLEETVVGHIMTLHPITTPIVIHS